jgi:hypothetical protein
MLELSQPLPGSKAAAPAAAAPKPAWSLAAVEAGAAGAGLRKGGVRTTLHSKLWLIDLAGSERATATEGLAEGGERAEEGKRINMSLTALGLCINALSSATAHKVRGRPSHRARRSVTTATAHLHYHCHRH